MKEYTMREAMEQSGCTRKAIRYYESQHLLSILRRNGKLFMDEENIKKLKELHFYTSFGLSLNEIQKLSQGQETEVLKDCIERVNKDIEVKYEQLEQIERMLDNAKDKHYECRQIEELLHLREDPMIHDMMILPWRKYNQYVIREIICTKKQYFLLRLLMRIFTLCLGIILCVVILERAGVLHG